MARPIASPGIGRIALSLERRRCRGVRCVGLIVSADSTSAMSFGQWGSGSSTARINKGRFCFTKPVTEECFTIFRNPGGTREKENEYFSYPGWAHPFSQVQCAKVQLQSSCADFKTRPRAQLDFAAPPR